MGVVDSLVYQTAGVFTDHCTCDEYHDKGACLLIIAHIIS